MQPVANVLVVLTFGTVLQKYGASSEEQPSPSYWPGRNDGLERYGVERRSLLQRPNNRQYVQVNKPAPSPPSDPNNPIMAVSSLQSKLTELQQTHTQMSTQLANNLNKFEGMLKKFLREQTTTAKPTRKKAGDKKRFGETRNKLRNDARRMGEDAPQIQRGARGMEQAKFLVDKAKKYYSDLSKAVTKAG